MSQSAYYINDYHSFFKKKVTILILSISFFFTANAQLIEPFTVNSGGGNYVNRGNFALENFSFIWSVGESTLIETFTTSNGAITLTQGVLQHFIEKDLQTIPIMGWSKEEVKVYPVPVSTLLHFDLFSNDTGKIVVQLFDILGRALNVSEFNYNTLPINRQIDFSKYPSGTYLLRLSLYSKGALKKNGIFKILKIR